MTMQGITVELPRIVGKAEFVAINEEGKIIKAFFIPTAPIRGFENLVKGKNPPLSRPLRGSAGSVTHHTGSRRLKRSRKRWEFTRQKTDSC